MTYHFNKVVGVVYLYKDLEKEGWRDGGRRNQKGKRKIFKRVKQREGEERRRRKKNEKKNKEMEQIRERGNVKHRVFILGENFTK